MPKMQFHFTEKEVQEVLIAYLAEEFNVKGNIKFEFDWQNDSGLIIVVLDGPPPNPPPQPWINPSRT